MPRSRPAEATSPPAADSSSAHNDDVADGVLERRRQRWGHQQQHELSLPLSSLSSTPGKPLPIKTPDSEYEDLPFPSLDGPSVYHGGGNPSHFPYYGAHRTDFGSSSAPPPRSCKTFYEVAYPEQTHSMKAAPRHGFLPGLPVFVDVAAVEKSLSHSFNPLLYTIQVSHGDFYWTIKRRYHHFRDLHLALRMYRTTEAIRSAPRRMAYSTVRRESRTREEQVDKPAIVVDEHREGSVGGEGRAESESDVDSVLPPRQPKEEQSDDGTSAPQKSVSVVEPSVLRTMPSRVSAPIEPVQLPRFPKKPDSLLNQDEIEKRQKQLENYLRALLTHELYRNHPQTLDFFEVSEFSFVFGTHKWKEGMLNKRVGDDAVAARGWGGRIKACLNYFRCWCCRERWRKLWVVVCETCIVGVAPKTGEVRLVLLFDKDFLVNGNPSLNFEVSSGFRHTTNRNSVLLANLTRGVCLKTWTARKTKEWIEGIQAVVTGEPAKCFIQANRFGSFAPVRTEQTGYWFVDGGPYMAAVCDAITIAKEEIFITDWWLSPEVYLKRGEDFSPALRLDLLLRKKAEEGVKIFVLLYKELQLALGLNSLYSKRALITRGGKNVKVFRHPDHASADMKDHLWAHHEKIVVVDQRYAFVGGIDLCYGRWDLHDHPLTDLDTADVGGGSDVRGVDVEQTDNKQPQNLLLGPGALLGMVPNTSTRTQRQGGGMVVAQMLRSAHELTVAPVRASSFADQQQPGGRRNSNGDDVDGGGGGGGGRVRRGLRTAVAKAKNRIPRRLRRRGDGEGDGDADSDLSFSDDSDYEGMRGIDNPISLSDERLHEAEDSISSLRPPADTTVLWRGKDYVNFIVKDVARPDQPEGDNVDRRTTPRMPWHDIAVMVQGAAARDVARHFIQRWNAIKTEKAKFNPSYPFLLPRPYHFDELFDVPKVLKNVPSSVVNCQVIRSASAWSAGIEDIEGSIHAAMVQAIREAQHYVYIENQFFISNAVAAASEVKNSICEALAQRIIKAHNCRETFRVFILLPLLPAFEGQIGSATGNALRTILHYQYASLSRGDNSLCGRLRKKGIDPFRYVSFGSLRTHSELLNTPITELIYIHSKLTIVDDRLVICGSANINDRSLLGNRDSEVALFMEDTEFEDGVMDGNTVSVGKFAGSMRRFLMREHLGLLDVDKNKANETVRDPISDEFFNNVWTATATTNTELFDDAFLVVPTDRVRTVEECQAYENRTPMAEFDRMAARKMLKRVKGNLVLLPLDFLANENLAPPTFTKEGLVPSITWM